MAKATGPLYSISASGKLADAMVFFTWKGVNVVRQWLKPANPQTANQGDQRIFMGGTGRAVGEIMPGKAFAQQLIDLGLIPGGQTKQSFMVKYILGHYLTDLTAYNSELASYSLHGAKTTFQADATLLGIVDFDLDYATAVAFDKGLGLYLIAKAAIALGFTGTPYTTALVGWTSTDVNGMVSDFTAV